MRIIHDLDEMTETARGWLSGGVVGFVPSSGNLHAGHLSLIRAARQESQFSVVSILTRTARTAQPLAIALEDAANDIQALQREQVDVLFLPRAEDMFPPSFATSIISTGPVAEQFEGALYPASIQRDAIAIVKLFQLVRPDVVYLGQKNAQHLALVRQLLRDLNIDIKLRVLPIVREADNLATSSQNALLSPPERQAALLLYQALLAGKYMIEHGERRVREIEKRMVEIATVSPLVKLDYAALCNPESFASPGEFLSPQPMNLLLLIAAHLGGARLTDNLLLSDGL